MSGLPHASEAAAAERKGSELGMKKSSFTRRDRNQIAGCESQTRRRLNWGEDNFIAVWKVS
jgi:hypothetical protein